MIIEDKYKLLASYRKGMRSFFYATIILGLFRTSWQTIPFILQGGELPAIWAMSLGLIVTHCLLHVIGSGWNTPHKENLLALRMHIIVGILTLTVVGYDVYLDHFQLAKKDRIPYKLAAFSATKAGPQVLGHVETLASVLQNTLDVCLGLALTASSIMTGAYLRMKGPTSSDKKMK
eukprot:jgi/Botrbrau1/20371/Bobra.0006s0034.2